MKTKSFTIIALACLLAVTVSAQTPVGTTEPTFENTTTIPHRITTPDAVDTPIGTLEFFDGVPIGDTTEKVYDYVDRARAVDVFINMMPAVSMYNIRQGQRDIGHTESNQIVIAEQMGDSKPLVLTWNNTSLYTWGFLDLKVDGPTVIEIPPDVLGILDDMYFRYITDMGAAGPDKGKGGKYLVLPPGYDGDVPEDGYYVVQSRTYTVWNFMRGYVRDSVKDAADNIKNNLKVYPLAQKDNPPKMEFLNMSGLAEYQTIPPNDFSFFEDLNAIIQEEPLDFIGPETRGQIAAIGIVKGQPFQPDGRMRRLLSEAADIGNAYARANTVFPRDPGHRYYPDTGSEWVMAFADNDYLLLKRRGAPRGLTPVDALQRRLRDTCDGAHQARRRIAICDRRSGLETPAARRRQDLQAAPAAQRAGQGQLVGDHLRHADPLHDADRREVRRRQQPEWKSEAERRRILRHLVRSDSA